MLDRPRFILFRHLFFPFSGEKPLTAHQGRQMILRWTLFFSFLLTLATVPTVLLIKTVSAEELSVIILLTFLGSSFIFALMTWFVVIMINRSALLIQKQQRLEGIKR